MLAAAVLVALFAAGARAAELGVLPEKLKFTFASTEKVKFFETLGGHLWECVKVSGSGEFTSQRLGLIELKYTGCEEPLKMKCTGLADGTAGTVTMKAEFHLRALLPSGSGVVMLFLFPAVHLSCGPILYTLSGCLSSMALLTKSGGSSVIGLLLSSMFLSMLQEKGDPKPIELDADNGLLMERCEPLLKAGGEPNELMGQLFSLTLEGFKSGESATTALIDLVGTF